MALKNVADTPFVANLNNELARAGAHLRKIPLNIWRYGLLALAALWICVSLARLFWLIMPRPEIPSVPVVAAPPQATATSGARGVDLAQLQALRLFGDFNAEAVAQSQPTPSDEANRPITTLNLELQGVIAASDPADSWAIIGQSGGEQKLYKVEDQIQGVNGVKVAEVLDLKVVLNNNGRLEDLWLYGEDGKNFANAAGNYSPPPVQSGPETQQASVSQQQLQEARNIGDVVRFVVATENGKMIGYKVRPGRKRALFDQAGLKTDDIVVSVNGIEVNEPQKIREVYQALKNASEAELQIMRDGATQSITITMSSEG